MRLNFREVRLKGKEIVFCQIALQPGGSIFDIRHAFVCAIWMSARNSRLRSTMLTLCINAVRTSAEK